MTSFAFVFSRIVPPSTRSHAEICGGAGKSGAGEQCMAKRRAGLGAAVPRRAVRRKRRTCRFGL